jgi:hypothetical protein
MDNSEILATLPTQDKGWRQTKPSRDNLKDEHHGLHKKSGWSQVLTKGKQFTDDHSRVILETDHGSGKSDYINANYIDVSMTGVKSLSWKCFFSLSQSGENIQ